MHRWVTHCNSILTISTYFTYVVEYRTTILLGLLSVTAYLFMESDTSVLLCICEIDHCIFQSFYSGMLYCCTPDHSYTCPLFLSLKSEISWFAMDLKEKEYTIHFLCCPFSTSKSEPNQITFCENFQLKHCQQHTV